MANNNRTLKKEIRRKVKVLNNLSKQLFEKKVKKGRDYKDLTPEDILNKSKEMGSIESFLIENTK